MNLMNVVRIAKVIALLAFVLPWVAISCSVPGQGSIDLATASGIELIQGKMTANPDAQKQMSRSMGLPANASGADTGVETKDAPPELGLNIFGIATAAVIVVGLLLSFAGKGAAAARNVLITSLLGAALAFGTVWWWKDQIKKEGMKDEQTSSSPLGDTSGNPFGGGGMNAMGANMLDSMLQERFGYWICFSALIVAAGAAGLGMAAGSAGATTKPEGGPPAA